MKRIMVRGIIRCRQQTTCLVSGIRTSSARDISTNCFPSSVYPSLSKTVTMAKHMSFTKYFYEIGPSINTSNTVLWRVFSSKTNSTKSETKKGNNKESGVSSSSTIKMDAKEKSKESVGESTKSKGGENTNTSNQSIPTEAASTPSPTSAATPENEPCPLWQNPIHHVDSNLEKIMLNEYKNDEKPSIVALPPFDDGSGKIIAPPHLHLLADEIVNMSMLEVKDLTDRLVQHFGIEEEDDDFMSSGDGDSAGGESNKPAEEEKKEEKKTFDLKLVAYDDKSKIKVIKEIRAITNLGLKEAKDLVEGVPKVVKKDIKKEEAEELKAKLVAAGATVEIA